MHTAYAFNMHLDCYNRPFSYATTKVVITRTKIQAITKAMYAPRIFITLCEISHYAPITETNTTKITLSAILTPFVTQNRVYLLI